MPDEVTADDGGFNVLNKFGGSSSVTDKEHLDESGLGLQFPLSMVTCPLSGQIMNHPIIVNGKDYEQEAII